ncbi:MAG: hypothetical protein FJ388_04450 [Verrucomicrobia bacterium]|nr:hypothetical protein [Verrucomicrobiota bacterium]
MTPSMQRERQCRWGVALALILVYAACISPHWKLGRDSSLYLALARSLAEGHGFTLAGLPYYGVPVGLPLMLAGIWRLAGPNYLVMNATMAVVALATLWFVYRSVSDIAGNRWGLLVVVLTGLSYRMVQFAGQILTDMPAMCCLWAGFYFLQRLVLRPQSECRNALAAGAAVAAGCAFRLSTPFFFPAIALAPWLAPRSLGRSPRLRLLHSVLVAAPAVLLVVAAMVFTPTMQGGYRVQRYWVWYSWEEIVGLVSLFGLRLVAFLDATLESITTQDFGAKRLLESGDGEVGRLVVAGLVLAALAAALAGGGWRLRRKDRGLGLLMVGCYMMGICLIAPMPPPRYVLPVLPWMYWFLAEALEAGWQRWKGSVASRGGQEMLSLSLPVAAVLALLLLPNLLKIGREVKLAHTRDYYAVYQRGHWKPYLEVAQWIRANTPERTTRLVTRESPVLAYLANRWPMPNPQMTLPGDLLVLDSSTQEARPEARDEFDAVCWRFVETGCARELHRSGPLVVYRVLRSPVPR